jgi:hypothetical protein
MLAALPQALRRRHWRDQGHLSRIAIKVPESSLRRLYADSMAAHPVRRLELVRLSVTTATTPLALFNRALRSAATLHTAAVG